MHRIITEGSRQTCALKLNADVSLRVLTPSKCHNISWLGDLLLLRHYYYQYLTACPTQTPLDGLY
jgi:hypothetical protein